MKLGLRDRPEAGGWAALFAAVAAIAVGQAVHVSNGQYSPEALGFLSIAVAALVAGVALSRVPGTGEGLARGTRAVALGGLGLQFYQLATTPPGWDLDRVPAANYLFLLAVFAALTGPVVIDRGGRALRCAWIAAFVGAAAWIMDVTPKPFIDVYHWTHQAAAAAAEGQNPYAIHMRNIYGKNAVYADGENPYGRPLSADAQWVLAGYPYPPLSLMIASGGVLFGDVRWANLACIAAGGAALLYGRGRHAPLAAALVLTTPHVFLMVQQGWTDAYCFGLLALTAVLAARSSPLTPWVFGLALVSKQYTLFLAPLGLLLVPAPWDRRRVVRFAARALLTGTLVTLPWIVWDLQAFLHSVNVPQIRFRQNSLSFLPLIVGDRTTPLVNAFPFLVLVATYALILVTSARGAAGFALSSALVLGGFFAFSKSAFTNQHFLILSCALTAFACGRRDESPRPEQSAG